MTDRDTLLVEATQRARKVGVKPEIMAAALLTQRGERPFVMETESRTAGESFFRVTQEGPTRVLYLNVGHPFYQTIYSPPGATARYRAAVEVFLWTLGIAELDADDVTRQQYLIERQQWSRNLGIAAPILDELLGYPDDRAREAEENDDELA